MAIADVKNPIQGCFVMTPSDTVKQPSHRAIYIGTGGDLVVQPFNSDGSNSGNTITFKNLNSGTILPGGFYLVMATNTTATDLVGVSNS